MKNTRSQSSLLARSLWLGIGVGCALACAPLGVRAQTDEEAKDKAAQSQPTDPAASKEGKLNAAAPGGPVKLKPKEALLVNAFGSGNAGEIRLAELALKNAESQDVKDYAQMMVTDHTKANEQLADVAKNHNIDFPPAPPAADVEMSKTLLDLKGAEFDKKYMGEVVKGHTNALAAYKKAKGEVKDHLLKEYVDGTEPTVAEHLKKAKEIDAKLTK